MEKITIGVPYEISIEPSIDIGKFDAVLNLLLTEFSIGIELQKIKGKSVSYSFIVPKSLEKIVKSKKVKYSILVTKDNARFEVDKGEIQFIDESSFSVSNAKIIPTEKSNNSTNKPQPPKEESNQDTKKESKVKENVDLNNKIDEAIKKATQPIGANVENEVKDSVPVSENENIEDTFSKIRRQSRENRLLGTKLEEIKKRNAERERKELINKRIKESLNKNTPTKE